MIVVKEETKTIYAMFPSWFDHLTVGELQLGSSRTVVNDKAGDDRSEFTHQRV